MFFPATPRLTLDLRGDWRDLWPSSAVLFARARFALFEGLVRLARHQGVRRLWIPAYLCAPVPESARAAGLAVALYDVDDRLAPCLDTIAPGPGDALLVVHYFGLVPPLARVRTFCVRHGMPLVEDCAHALPDPRGEGAGSAGDVAVFSLRKLGPMPGGGLLVVRDGLRRFITPRAARLLPDGRTLGRLAIMVAERAAEAIGLNPVRLKDRLPVLDASDGRLGGAPRARASEYRDPPRPSHLIRAMFAQVDWRRVIDRRRDAYRRLADHLARVPALTAAVPEPPPASVPESFPVLLAEPSTMARRLRALGVEAMRWPGAEQFAFDRDAFPGARTWLEQGLCLPLGTSLTPARVARLAESVRAAMTTEVEPETRPARVA